MSVRRELPMGEVVTRYAGGESLRQLAARYGVAVATVRSRLAEAGVTLRRRGAPASQVDVAGVRRHVQAGASMRAAAAVVGVSRSTLGRRLSAPPSR
jgi:transposase